MNRLRDVSLIRDNFVQLKFVLKSKNPFMLVDQPLMTADVMLSSIGGSLSLWLGITVMTFVEVAEFIYTMIAVCTEKRRNKNAQKG